MSSRTAHQERLMQVLIGPHVSEKSTLLSERRGQVAFKVLPTATKQEVKQAVELLFEVNVTDVTVSNVKGKAKRFGAVRGRRSDWKKAYVSLAEGQEISFLGAE